MPTTATPDACPCTFVGRTTTARVDQAEAERVLARVHGMRAGEALVALRFAAGTVCAPVARVVQQALADAERHGLTADVLVLTATEVGAGESLTRVRRHAHGIADWITTETTALRVELKTMPDRVAHSAPDTQYRAR